jgi:hypothetical protein
LASQQRGELLYLSVFPAESDSYVLATPVLALNLLLGPPGHAWAAHESTAGSITDGLSR